MNREHGEWTARLSEYLAGELGESDRRAVEEHLSACEACSRVREDLSLVVARAGALQELVPPDHLWEGISAALDESKPGSVLPFPAPRRPATAGRGLVTMSWPRLAVAAAALVTVTALVSLWAGSSRAGMPASAGSLGAGVVTGVGNTSTPPEGMAEELAALEEILESARSVLDPNTVRVIERSLGVIEQAIADSRDALTQDPGNAFLAEHLDRMYRRKLVYLQDAVRLVEFGG